MSVSIKDLEAFVKLYESGNMRETATELGLTQPTISYRIKELEDFFEKEIVVRKSNRNIFFSDFANALYLEATRILRRLYELKAFNEFDLKKSTIEISSGEIAGIYFLPTMVKSFQDKSPEILVNVKITSSQKAIEILLNEEADIAFVSSRDLPELKKSESGFKIIDLIPIELVVVAPKGHPIVEKKSVSLKDIVENDYSYLSRSESSGIQIEFLNLIKEEGLRLHDFNIVQTFENSASVLNAVAEGLGLSVVSKLQAQRLINAGLIDFAELNAPIETKLYIVDRWNGRSDLINKFVRFTEYYVHSLPKKRENV